MNKSLLISIMLFWGLKSYSQIGINATNTAPDATAMLDVSSTTKGALLPRMTTAQKNAIPMPTLGLTVFDTDTKSYWYFDGVNWASIGGSYNHWTNNYYNVFPFNPMANIGIGTTSPVEKFHVGSGNVQFGNNDSDPNTFKNILFWRENKGALRAGTPMGTEWDYNNTGEGSFANGYGTKASGIASVALNAGNTSSNFFATTMGFGNTASGQTALAMGEQNIAGDANSVVMGFKNQSNGSTNGKYTPSFVLGSFNNPISNSLFTIGNGRYEPNPMGPPTETRQNAMVVMENGKVGIGIDNPSAKLHVFGENAYLWGITLGFGTSAAVIQTDDNSKPMVLQEGNIETMRLQNGFVGIGTTSPQAKLHVNGQMTSAGAAYAFYAKNTMNNNPYTGSANAQESDVSIIASNRIRASEFNAMSDSRIKNIIGLSNNTNDLELLSKLKITDYTYVDKVERGSKVIKKVIAQDLEKVYPNAVSLTTEVIPDIFKLAKIEKGIISLKNDFKQGEKVKLVFKDKSEILNVLEANEASFKVNKSENGEVFVYGRQVNDFRVVDYEAIAMLNVSATQALLKRIEVLEKENLVLKTALQSQIAILEAKISNQNNMPEKSKIVYK